jgi:5'-methylthioadenosine phosphorylase
MTPRAEIGVIGGSGLYALAALDDAQDVRLATPFGEPADKLRIGRIGDRVVAFLARHGRTHRLLPGEIDHRANVYALKSIGVSRVLSVSAVGSMREEIRPRDVVLVDQFIDRTVHRPGTFFGDGIAAHVSFADPVCPELHRALGAGAAACRARAHARGTYLCIEGPAFSTRAESRLYRTWDVDVIGMTNLPEAKLAREAEMCYATLALVTDYDCWHETEADVTVAAVIENLRANAALAAEILGHVIRHLPRERVVCGCGRALEHAILTPPEAIPHEARKRLRAILGDEPA